jgi:hypothetical protein
MLDRTHRATLQFTTPIAAQVALTWTAAESGTRPPAPLPVASATHVFSTPGTARLTLRLTAAGRALFRAATGPVRLTATATFAASTGSITATNQLTFRGLPRRRHHR